MSGMCEGDRQEIDEQAGFVTDTKTVTAPCVCGCVCLSGEKAGSGRKRNRLAGGNQTVK